MNFPIDSIKLFRIQPDFRRLALKTHHTIVRCITSIIIFSSVTLAVHAQEHPTAKELLTQAITLYEQGDLEKANATLQRIDVVQLSPGERDSFVTTLKDIRIKQKQLKADAAAGKDTPEPAP